MKKLKRYKCKPSHLHPNASGTLSLRTVPAMKQWIHDTAVEKETSMTNIMLWAVNLLYRHLNPSQTNEHWYWDLSPQIPFLEP